MQNNESAGLEQELRVRKLGLSDKGKGFIELLQQLSVCDSVSDKEFHDRFHELSSLGDDRVTCVIGDELSGRIIAAGSVLIGKKFLRNCGKVGHIEDVVVDSSARGKQLGKKVIQFLTDHARSMGCYKVILDCSLENKVFYEKCGFKHYSDVFRLMNSVLPIAPVIECNYKRHRSMLVFMFYYPSIIYQF